MLSVWGACLLLCWAGTSSARAEPPPEAPLLVVEVAEVDHPAAQRLLALMEQPTQLMRLTEAREPAASLPFARAAGAPRVVIFDQGTRRVLVLRSEDGAQWQRDTSEDATPFVLAFVATELLRLSEGASLPTPFVPPVIALDDSFGLSWLGFRFGLEALPLAPYRGAPRPTLGVLAALGRPRAPLALLLELHVAPHAQKQHTVADARLRIARTDLTARAGVLWQQQRLALSVFASAGVLLGQAQYRGATERDQQRASLLAGLGVEPMLQLALWLRVYLSCSATLAATPAEYRAGGVRLLEEPRLALQLGAGMWLTLPNR